MKKITLLAALFIFIIFLPACNVPRRTPTPAATPTPSATPTLTPTPIPSTATPIPMAALVNGDGITLGEYQAETARYQAVFGTDLATGWQKRVMQDLIDQTLLAQAAREKGYTLSDADFQARMDDLAQQAGGDEMLAEWMQAHGYLEQGFRQALGRSLAAAWMRDQITEGVSWLADQVHARQILLYNLSDASNILSQLNNGADFTTLAYQYDPATGGDLGWFPERYLTEQALETAVFLLEPGKYSEVVETSLGFHIVLVIEHDPQHLLTPDARMALQGKVLSSWMVERRGQSDIQILVP